MIQGHIQCQTVNFKFLVKYSKIRFLPNKPMNMCNTLLSQKTAAVVHIVESSLMLFSKRNIFAFLQYTCILDPICILDHTVVMETRSNIHCLGAMS